MVLECVLYTVSVSALAPRPMAMMGDGARVRNCAGGRADSTAGYSKATHNEEDCQIAQRSLIAHAGEIARSPR